MKKIHALLLVAVLCLSVGALPASAKGAKSTIKVINQSKWEIHHLYLSPSRSNHWGEDLLGEDILEKGDQITLTDIACDHYDIKVVDEDGDECVIENESLCGDKAFWKITDKELLACEGRDDD
jgi:hypothetical protein